MTSSPAILVSGVSCRYGHVAALRDVMLEIPSGTVTALVGPNGAGKTTLLRVLATLARPTAGSAWITGVDVRSDPDAVRRQIGFVGHNTWLYPELSAVENLRFHGRLHGVNDLGARIRVVLGRAGLLHRRHDRCRTFSRGTAQRLAIARALLHEPAVMLLDEPHTGLDQAAAEVLDESLRSMADAGRTVLLATHDLERVSHIADRVVLLSDGVVVWQGAMTDTTDSMADVSAWYRQWTEAVTAARPSLSVPPTDQEARKVATAREDDAHDAPGVRDAVSPETGQVAGDEARAAEAGGVGADAAATIAPPGRDGAAGTVASSLEVMRAIVWKDITIEWRARESVPPVLVFGLLVTVIFQFVLPPDGFLRAAAAPGVLWVALLFGTTLGFARLLGAEVDSGGLTALSVSPVDRGAVFAGKWFAAYMFSALVAAILLPALVVLLGLTLTATTVVMLGAVAAAALAGWSATGVMLGTVAVSARAREVLLPVLLYPLVLPLVVPAVHASGAVIRGDPTSALVAPLALILAYDVIFWVMGFLLYGYVMED